MAIISNPSKAVTIEEFIECSDLVRISYNNLSLIQTISDDDTNIELVMFNVLDDYIEEFKERAKLVELSDEAHLKYYQAPKLLSYDLYRNTELDFIILRLNGIYDDKDFDMKKVYLLESTDMKDLCSQLYNAEKSFINSYNDEHNEEG